MRQCTSKQRQSKTRNILGSYILSVIIPYLSGLIIIPSYHGFTVRGQRSSASLMMSTLGPYLQTTAPGDSVVVGKIVEVLGATQATNNITWLHSLWLNCNITKQL